MCNEESDLKQSIARSKRILDAVCNRIDRRKTRRIKGCVWSNSFLYDNDRTPLEFKIIHICKQQLLIDMRRYDFLTKGIACHSDIKDRNALIIKLAKKLNVRRSAVRARNLSISDLTRELAQSLSCQPLDLSNEQLTLAL